MTADEALSGEDLSGKVFVVTGSNGHIATEVNKALARANATLILACRLPDECAAVQEEITKATGGRGVLELGTLDLSSKQSIREFVKNVAARHPQGISGLVNSAGMYSTRLSKDGFVDLMVVNLLGPALLTELMLPLLRGNANRAPGRVVNVAAAVWGTQLPANTTAADLAQLCTHVDPELNRTGAYFTLSKFLLIHHALELAKREPNITSFAVNPGLGVEKWPFPQWVLRLPYPAWLRKKIGLPSDYFTACKTNFKGLAVCPQKYDQAAAVISTAAAAPDIASFSGSYLDFDTKMLPPDAKQVFGPFTQSDPTCVPRTPPEMESSLQANWYDKMLQMMTSKDRSHEILV